MLHGTSDAQRSTELHLDCRCFRRRDGTLEGGAPGVRLVALETLLELKRVQGSLFFCRTGVAG